MTGAVLTAQSMKGAVPGRRMGARRLRLKPAHDATYGAVPIASPDTTSSTRRFC